MRKFLLSALALLLVIGLVGAGSFAWFQDTETSTGNIFTAGTLDLELRNGAWGVPIIGLWTASNMAPGDSWDFAAEELRLRNVGSLEADHLEITADYTVTGVPPPFNPDTMAEYMEITYCRYGDGFTIDCLTGDVVAGAVTPPSGFTPGDWQIADEDGDGRITFADLRAQPLDNLPPPQAGVSTRWFQMSVRFNENAGNEFQGATFDLTMIFTLNQDSNQ